MARLRSLRQRAWEKCGGICYLCGLPMMPNVEPGDPLAYTLEHIIPKALGGQSDTDNVNGAHQYCNNYKGDSLISDLPSGYRAALRWKIKNLLAHMKVK